MAATDYGSLQNEEPQYRLYTRRWFVALSVFLLNVSNGALWITYAPVSTIAASFYDTTPDIINYFSMSYLLIALPFSFICTYLIIKRGLFFLIHTGAVLNTLGAVIKAVGTAPFITSPSTSLAISFVGQIFCAMAQSFLFYISTKTSQTWFARKERMGVTTVVSMADPVGAVVAQIVTPYIVTTAADMPVNNYVWMGVALACHAVTLASVHRSHPEIPPTPSSGQTSTSWSWAHQVKAVFTNKSYLILFMSVGYSIALYTAISTVTQQTLCGLGYSTIFCGYASSFPQLFGFVGSAVIGAYVTKTRNYIITTKIVYAVGALAGILMCEFYLVPDQHAMILVSCAIFGFFGVGGFPVGLELGVETTYPVEETISSAFILMSGQIEGVILIQVMQGLAVTAPPQYQALQVCSIEGDDITPFDYKYAMIFLMVVTTVVNLSLVLFFDTEYHRHNADTTSPDSKPLPHHPDYVDGAAALPDNQASTGGAKAPASPANKEEIVTDSSRSSSSSIERF